MHRKMLVVSIAALAMACATLAQQKPDFSGTWKLNVSKSDFGPVAGPTAQTDVITQKGDTLTVNVSATMEDGTKQYTIRYVADGKEVTIPADAPGAHPTPDVTMQSISAAWDGPVLVVNQKLLYGDAPVTGASRYSLSADGKVLTVDSDYTSQMGDATRTFVYDKADSSAAGASPAMAPPNASSNAGTAASTATAGMAGAGNSSEKPDLSGTWVLDIPKSDFGQMPPPESRTDIIEDKNPSVKITVNQNGQMGEMNFTMDLVADGTTVAKWMIFGNEARSTAHWEGNTLVVKTDSKYQDDPVSFVGKYTLNPDGKTMIVQDHFSGPMGEGDAKLVFNKK